MNNQGSPIKGLSVEQKTAFVLLLIFGILVIGMGILQLRNTIYNPFVIKTSQNQSADYTFLNEAVRQQRMDTDNDGLSDYDELNFYSTSPYLPDTDSDGLSDKTEIDNGTNPLCPEGNTCEVLSAPQTGVTVEEPVLPTNNSLDLLDNLTGIQDNDTQGTNLAELNLTDQTEINKILQDPEVLRYLLLQTGQITGEQLSQISDADLLEVFNNLEPNK